MKNYLKIFLFASVIVIGWLLLDKCSDNSTTKELKDNTILLEKLKPLKAELAVLRAKNDSLELSYQNKKNVKDSLVIRTKTKYITVYDTLTKDTYPCLPKVYVDTIVLTYENLLNDADTIIKVKSLTIENLTTQNTIKDTIINNYQNNELIYKQEIKKQKNKKWLFGGVGAGIGYFLGKIF